MQVEKAQAKKAERRERTKEMRTAQKEKEKEKNHLRRERERNKKQKEKQKVARAEEREADRAVKEELARMPKRAKSAFMFFSIDKRPSVSAANKGISVLDISRKLGEQWKALSEEGRKVYKEKALVDKDRSKRERTEYEKTLPPKRNPSPYILFLKDVRPKVKAENEKAPVTEIAKKVAVLWNALSASEKEAYKHKSIALKTKYQKDKAAWEEAFAHRS